MKRYVGIFVLGSLALLLPGCATIIKGTHADLSVDTSPPGARVYVDGRYVGTSPTTVVVHHADHQIRVERAGFTTETAQMTASFSGWTLLGGLVGVVIDAITGAITTMDESHVSFELQPQAPAGPIVVTPVPNQGRPTASQQPGGPPPDLAP